MLKKEINSTKTSYLNPLLRFSTFFGLLLICLFCLPSCSDDDDDQDELVGSWAMQQLFLTNCADPSNNQSFIFDESGCTDLNGGILCTTGVITFSEDGSYQNVGNVTFDGVSINDLNENGTWSRTGSTVVLCDATGDCNGSTIEIDGNQITVRDTAAECNRRSEYSRR